MIEVIGAGLAGCETAYFLAQKGIDVALIEQKPRVFTPAHKSENLSELVCSNSLKSDDIWGNACGLLKEELRKLGSVTMQAAEIARIPAGGALAVDREVFSSFVTQKIKSHPRITVIEREQTKLPQRGVVATGPLTAGALYEEICTLLGGSLHFFDASAPIVSADSIDETHVFTGDRYGKGTGDYLNCPLTKEEYETFVQELLVAEKATLHSFEKKEIFEGCMPVEVMASRGKDTLRFGTFKPVGLSDEQGNRPYAVLQLRKENEQGSCYGLVGCQTNLKFGEQKRVFGIIPALKNAVYERYGVMHRNTYLHSPDVLNADFSLKTNPLLFFAGQITGVEGYVESAMSGLLVGIHLWRKLQGKESILPPESTVCGALSRYIATPNKDFSPMNANYGIMQAGFGEIRDKKLRKQRLGERALETIERYRDEIEA